MKQKTYLEIANEMESTAEVIDLKLKEILGLLMAGNTASAMDMVRNAQADSKWLVAQAKSFEISEQKKHARRTA